MPTPTQTTTLAPGALAVYSLALEDGTTKHVLGSSLEAAIMGTKLSPVVGVTRTTLADIPVAAVTSLVPASAKLGDPSFTLHVHGTGFVPSSVIVWNGLVEPTTFVSATELTTGVAMETANVAIQIPVAVQGAAGQLSNALTFDMQPADPI